MGGWEEDKSRQGRGDVYRKRIRAIISIPTIEEDNECDVGNQSDEKTAILKEEMDLGNDRLGIIQNGVGNRNSRGGT